MTDYMPIVLPTKEKVEAMLKGTSHKPDEIVGKLSPAPGAFPEWTFNVRQVAINAVMGGETNTYWLGRDFSYVTSASIDSWR